MILGLITGHGLWEYVTVLFDNIPKIIYLIYTAIASCLDLLQCIIRKLAGLDTYWINGQAYTQQDPVLEFIYGMLGIGEHSGVYSPLSTVFWSIAIFGLIVLVLATMVAIIKSHYNEDTNKTNPLTYVYTAIKAIFTFAIVPVAVILGIYISQFLLQTADNITAGKSDDGAMTSIYGADVLSKDILVAGKNGSYGRYDFFGFGTETTTTPISGMLFRVAAYDANRVRKYDDVLQALKDGEDGPNALFGDVSNLKEGESEKDHVAYQVDYAFMNNLQVKGTISAKSLLGSGWGSGYGIGHHLITIGSVDFFSFAGASEGFSKYNVGLVWYYYYLWNFNFFVGFASIIISFGLLTSIIVGLMSRLIYSAALFLIYPGTLGLAPLDEWNAFKKWRSEFVSQILMAFGSIIGMNIIFLILPYVNEFQWFNWGVLALPNTIINTLIIITGLLLIKEFITFISGLIGAKSAADTGDNTKKAMTPILAKAGKATLGAANIGWKAGMAIPRLLGKGMAADVAEVKVKKLDTQIAGAEHLKAGADAEVERAQEANDLLASDLMKKDPSTAGPGYRSAFKKFEAQANAKGVFEGSDEYNRMKAEFVDDYLSKNDSTYQRNKATIADKGYTAAGLTKDQQDKVEGLENLKTKRKQIIARNYLNDQGQIDDDTTSQIGRNLMRSIVGSIVKGAKEGLPDITGIKFDAIKGVFNAANNNIYDDKGKAIGSYSAGPSNADYRSGNVPSTWETIKQGFGNVFSAAGAPAPSTEPAGDKAMLAASKELAKATADIKSATQDLRRYRPRP